jgi:hypothetical protein
VSHPADPASRFERSEPKMAQFMCVRRQCILDADVVNKAFNGWKNNHFQSLMAF